MIQLAIKDLKLFLKDRRSVLLGFIVPIALITLFAFAFGGAGRNDNDTKVSLLISDLDNTEASREAFSRLDTLASIQLKPMPLEKAQRAIEKGDESCVLVIHRGFSDSLHNGVSLPLELQYDPAQEFQVGLIQQSLVPTMAMLPFTLGNSKKMIGRRLSKMAGSTSAQTQEEIELISDNLFDAMAKGVSESDEKTEKQGPVNFMGAEIKMTKLIKNSDGSQLGLIQAVAGTAVMMLLFSVVGIGMEMLDEKKEGTLKRLLYAPMKPEKILVAKMISSNIVAIIQLFVMFIFARIAFGLNISAHLPGLVTTIIATAFACSAFGIFLASFAQSRRQVQGLSTLTILIMSAVGGSMVPLFLMPEIMQKAAIISVNFWSIQSFFDIFWRNLSVWDATFLWKIIMLIAIGLVLNFSAILLFRKNIRNIM